MPLLIVVIGKRTDVLIVLGVALAKRMHSQLIRPYQFQSLASLAAALRQFRVNPQTGLAKCGLSKVKPFDIISVGMVFLCSCPRILQVDIMDISRFGNRSPLGDLLV